MNGESGTSFADAGASWPSSCTEKPFLSSPGRGERGSGRCHHGRRVVGSGPACFRWLRRLRSRASSRQVLHSACRKQGHRHLLKGCRGRWRALGIVSGLELSYGLSSSVTVLEPVSSSSARFSSSFQLEDASSPGQRLPLVKSLGSVGDR